MVRGPLGPLGLAVFYHFCLLRGVCEEIKWAGCYCTRLVVLLRVGERQGRRRDRFLVGGTFDLVQEVGDGWG